MRALTGDETGMRSLTMWLLLAVAPAALCGAVGGAAVPEGAVDILTTESYWRWYKTLRPPVIPVAALKAAGEPSEAPRLLVGREVPPPYGEVDHQSSPPPPAGWETTACDDYGWPRARLSWLRGPACGRFSSAALCLRGRFQVDDPAAVQGLYLTMRYYGGVRVFLNGKEVARQHLPSGALAPETPAEMYPKEVYLDDKGTIVPFGDYEYGWSRVQGDARKDAEERRARRTRVLGPLQLPAAAIRKGENLLAVELRRCEYPFEALRWFKSPEGVTKPFWKPINIFDLRLQAAGGGVTPNVGRPSGLQVWSENSNDRITTLDFGDAGEGLRPVRIVGARNGTFLGQFVIGADRTIEGLKVTAGDLRAVKGAGVIPAAAIELLYALPDKSYYGQPTWFDGLQAAAPATVAVAGGGGAVQPVLLRVRIARETPAGNYRGETLVAMAGADAVRVPVEVSVADWILPDPKEYRTYVGVYQSPTSLAMQYKVPEWSEEHWKLMERSFALLGRAGNRLVNITVSDRTQFGNDEGMIHWVKKADGSYGYDFKVFDRYMDLAQRHFALDFVALHIWHSGGWETRGADQVNTVTVVDERTGARSRLQVPRFDTEESRRFWKPLLEAAQARLAGRGLGQAMLLGILSDGTAPKEVFASLHSIAPGGARWMRGCHSGTYSETPYGLPGGGVVALHEFCYGTPLDKAQPAQPYHKQRHWPGTDYERMGNHDTGVPLSWYRETGMTALMRRTRGVGRICLDFFDVFSGRQSGVGSGNTIYNRWPFSSCAQREPSLKSMLWPAPEGPATTLRYEAFCEGIQYAEAMVALSEAIDVQAAALGEEKVAAYRRLLTDMWQREVRADRGSPLRPDHGGWQEQMRALFAAAGECARLGPALR